jgi:hypothetical protein
MEADQPSPTTASQTTEAIEEAAWRRVIGAHCGWLGCAPSR